MSAARPASWGREEEDAGGKRKQACGGMARLLGFGMRSAWLLQRLVAKVRGPKESNASRYGKDYRASAIANREEAPCR